jgi:hypothetical protein
MLTPHTLVYMRNNLKTTLPICNHKEVHCKRHSEWAQILVARKKFILSYCHFWLLSFLWMKYVAHRLLHIRFFAVRFQDRLFHWVDKMTDERGWWSWWSWWFSHAQNSTVFYVNPSWPHQFFDLIAMDKQVSTHTHTHTHTHIYMHT